MYPQLHIPDGFLSPQISLLLWVATAVLVGIAVRRTGRADVQMIASQPILMGVLGAFIFAAQMFNFPVATGTSGHLLGGVLAGYLLGPWAGTIVVSWHSAPTFSTWGSSAHLAVRLSLAELEQRSAVVAAHQFLAQELPPGLPLLQRQDSPRYNLGYPAPLMCRSGFPPCSACMP